MNFEFEENSMGHSATAVQISTEETGTLPEVSVEIFNGKVTTTSLDVAKYFHKRHDNVIRDIENLIAQLPPDYLLNFEEVIIEYENGKGGTQQAPAYRITRDGFTLLAMGFTGKRALQFKLAYINAFNRMEQALSQQKDEDLAEAKSMISLHVAEALHTTLELVRQIQAGPSDRPDVTKMLSSVLNVRSLKEVPKEGWGRIPDFLQGLIVGEVASKKVIANSIACSPVATDLVYRIVQVAHHTEMQLNTLNARQMTGKQQYGDPATLYRIADELTELSRLTRDLIRHMANYPLQSLPNLH